LIKHAAPPVTATPSLHDALPICSFAGGLVDIAKGRDARIGIQRRIVFDMVGTAAPEAHNADIDAIVGAEDGELGGGDGCGGCFQDRKSTRLNSSHEWISYAVFCL